MSEDSDTQIVIDAEEAYATAVAKAPPPEPVQAEEKPLPAAAVAKPARKARVARSSVEAAAVPAAKAKRGPKPGKRKSAASAPKPATGKPVSRKVGRPVAAKKAAPVQTPQTINELKEKIMAAAKKTKPEYTKLLETAQTKAKQAYVKGASVAAEVGAFSKGNVEAVVASGKILGEGVKTIGQDYVAEAKGAFATLTGDFKALAGVKSPTELFQLQGKLARRNFDQAVAYSSKTTESLVKLANEVLAPISNRVSIAVDKVSKAA